MATDKVLHGARAYDLLVWVLTLGRERALRERLVEFARLESGESVLDVGCGTGALAIAAKDRLGPGGQVCGVDPSSEMVARARRKTIRVGVDVRFETAAVEALPFPDATFDAVLSSLMLHHLSEEGRGRASPRSLESSSRGASSSPSTWEGDTESSAACCSGCGDTRTSILMR